MTNTNVYKNKLKLPEKYLDDPHVKLILNKPGTLSKKEKEWLRSYIAVLELKDIKPDISRSKLSEAFVKLLKQKRTNNNVNIYSK